MNKIPNMLLEEIRVVQRKLRKQNTEAYSRAARAAIAFIKNGDEGDQKTALISLARSDAFLNAEQITMDFVKKLENFFGEPIEPLETDDGDDTDVKRSDVDDKSECG